MQAYSFSKKTAARWPSGLRKGPDLLHGANDSDFVRIEKKSDAYILRLKSSDGTNRLTRSCIEALTSAIHTLTRTPRPLIIAGNEKYFSAGADLEEIRSLNAVTALEFSRTGQILMRLVEQFPAPVYAAISGYCMGGGLDLALACHRRIAAPNAVFGHRGAALGLITGWGGTQRLPRLIGKGRAFQMFVSAEKIDSQTALKIGLVDGIDDDPAPEALRRIKDKGVGILTKSE